MMGSPLRSPLARYSLGVWLVLTVATLAVDPASSAASQDQLPGVEDAVSRSFVSSDGSQILFFAAARFSDDGSASSGLLAALDRLSTSLAEAGLPVNEPLWQSTPVADDEPPLGDERVVRTGVWRNADGTDLTATMVGARSGRLVVLGVSFGPEGTDAVPMLTTALSASVARSPGTPAASPRAMPGAPGLRSDGLFAILPTLDDVPSGFTFQGDYPPSLFLGPRETTTDVFFDPVPGGTPSADA